MVISVIEFAGANYNGGKIIEHIRFVDACIAPIREQVSRIEAVCLAFSTILRVDGAQQAVSVGLYLDASHNFEDIAPTEAVRVTPQ